MDINIYISILSGSPRVQHLDLTVWNRVTLSCIDLFAFVNKILSETLGAITDIATHTTSHLDQLQ